MIEHWNPSTRSRFTATDLDYLVSVLVPGGQRHHLEKLWNDPETRRELLDLKEVLHGLLDAPTALLVSPRFYFYVLVRHAFLQAELTDAALADYVAGAMVKRINPSPEDPLFDVARGYTHASEFMALIASAKGRMRFHLHVAAGDQFLILTGLYPRYLKNRSERGATTDLEFYESFARRSFRNAAEGPHAPCKASRHLLASLADALPVARRSLNKVAEEFVFLGD